MADFKPANSKEFQEYFRTETDARQVQGQLASSHPDTEYIVTRTSRKPDYPYEIYYRGHKKVKQASRLQAVVRKLRR